MDTQMFSVLAEPNRLDIVEFLYKNPRPVKEIVARLHLSQPQVSKHLKVLAEAGLVGAHPSKNLRIYALKPQPFKQLDRWLTKYRILWEERFDRLSELLMKEGGGKNGRRV